MDCFVLGNMATDNILLRQRAVEAAPGIGGPGRDHLPGEIGLEHAVTG